MASVDEFGAAVDVVSIKLDDTISALGAAKAAGNDLVNVLQAMNIDGRAAETRAVVGQVDGETGQAAAFKSRIADIRAAVEALRGLLANPVSATAQPAGSSRTPYAPPPLVPRPPSMAATWPHRSADSGKGQIWQHPGATGNADMVRVMAASPRYPHGYVRFYNAHGQPVGVNGKPGSRADTHIPVAADGTYPTPQGWHHD